MTRTAPPTSRSTRPAAGERSKRALAERARKKRQRLIGSAVAAVLLVAVAVFAVQRATPATSSLTTASSGARGGPAEVGKQFPDFRLVTVDGAQVTPDKLLGGDTILWFTTSYCVPCQIGAVKYQPLAGELGAKAPTMLFVFLDPQEPDAALRGFRDKYALPQWQMAMDTDTLGQRAGVKVLDTKIFVDETGVVRDINTVPVNDSYLSTVRRLATGA